MPDPITPLPPAPSRQDPENFADEADLLLSALPTMVEEFNAAFAALAAGVPPDTISDFVLSLFDEPDAASFLNALGIGAGAPPSGLVGLLGAPGTLKSYIRSDGAPALWQGIAPVWTGAHTFRAGNATTARWFASFSPSDYGVGKPALYINKSPNATQWDIGLTDGASAAGVLNFSVDYATVSKDFNVTRNLNVGGFAQINAVPSGLGAQLYFDAPAGQSKAIFFRTGVAPRWLMYITAEAESGSNAGSNFGLARYNDAGALVDHVLSFSRATGAPAVSNPAGWRSALAAVGLADNNNFAGQNQFQGITLVGSFQTLGSNAALLGVNPHIGAYAAQFQLNVAAAHQCLYIRNDRTDSNPMQFMFGGGTMVGSITQNGVNTAFNTSSDYRLKENIAPLAEDGLAAILALRPVLFGWKSRPELGPQPGFLAHEVQAIRPHAVSGVLDEMEALGTHYGIDEVEVVGEDGETRLEAREVIRAEDSVEIHGLTGGERWEKTGERMRPQQLDPSKLIADLVAAVQVLAARVAALEAQP